MRGPIPYWWILSQRRNMSRQTLKQSRHSSTTILLFFLTGFHPNLCLRDWSVIQLCNNSEIRFKEVLQYRKEIRHYNTDVTSTITLTRCARMHCQLSNFVWRFAGGSFQYSIFNIYFYEHKLIHISFSKLIKFYIYKRQKNGSKRR